MKMVTWDCGSEYAEADQASLPTNLYWPDYCVGRLSFAASDPVGGVRPTTVGASTAV